MNIITMALRSLRALRAPSPHQPLTLRLHLYGGPSGFTVYMLNVVPLTGLKPPNRTFLDLTGPFWTFRVSAWPPEAWVKYSMAQECPNCEASAGAEDRIHSRLDVVAVSLEVFARFITRRRS